METNVKYTRVEYSKTFSLGNYENERIGLTAEVTEGANMLQAMNQIRDDVEAVHNYRRDLAKFENAQRIVKNREDYVGREVTRSEEFIADFYNRYPFHRPDAPIEDALQLTETPNVEFIDHKEKWDQEQH